MTSSPLARRRPCRVRPLAFSCRRSPDCQREFARLANSQPVQEFERYCPYSLSTFQYQPGLRDGYETCRFAFPETARVTIQKHHAVLIVETPIPLLRTRQIDRLKRGHCLLFAPSSPRDFRAERTRSFTL